MVSKKEINALIGKGIEDLIKQNPRFENYRGLLVEHTNIDGIYNKFNDSVDSHISRGYTVKESEKKALLVTENYISSGNLFDDYAKKIILREGKLEKSLLEKIVSPFQKKGAGTNYLDRTTESFRELISVIKEGGYNVPEVEKPLVNLYRLGFVSPAIAVLAEGGFINKSQEKSMIKNLYKANQQYTEEVVSGINKYITPQKVAASIIGFIGTFLILFNLNMTGAVISEGSTVTNGIIGVFMVFLALLLYLRPLKKSFKKQ